MAIQTKKIAPAQKYFLSSADPTARTSPDEIEWEPDVPARLIARYNFADASRFCAVKDVRWGITIPEQELSPMAGGSFWYVPYALAANVDWQTVSWFDVDGKDGDKLETQQNKTYYTFPIWDEAESLYVWYHTDDVEKLLEQVRNNGLSFFASYGIVRDVDKPFTVLTNSDLSLIYDYEDTLKAQWLTTALTPAGGSVPQGTINFSWQLTEKQMYMSFPGFGKKQMWSFAVPEVTAQVLHWRVSGGTAQTMQLQPGDRAAAVDTGALSTDTVEWWITLTDEAGQSHESAHKTLTMVESVPVASPVSPIGTIVDGTQPVTFRWNHFAGGTRQSRFQLQISRDGEAWGLLEDENTTQQSYTVPGNTFEAGELYWRVRTYNQAGVSSVWSQAAKVLMLSAPPAPIVTIQSSSPAWAISWEATGQQGWEVYLDGKLAGSGYGTGTTFQSRGYLPSGSYLVQVRVQNVYSLWSPLGDAALNVENDGGEEITLTVEAAEGGAAAALAWASEGSYTQYVVYRDGAEIARTGMTRFTDAIGPDAALYRVRGVDEDGNFEDSNEVAAEIQPDCLTIYDLQSRTWLRLEKSEVQLPELGVSTAQTVAYHQIAGQARPLAEVAAAVQQSISFVCAFNCDERALAAQFEEKVGKLVCIKDGRGLAAVGVLDGWNMVGNTFYRAYSATLTPVLFNEVSYYAENV